MSIKTTKRHILECYVGKMEKIDTICCLRRCEVRSLFSNTIAKIGAAFSEGGLAESAHTKDV